MKIIESIDFLGKKPTLLIDKQESHKSFLGGILSFLTIVAILAGTAYFLSIIFSRETFTLVQSEKLDLLQTMSINDFPIGAVVLDSLARELPDGDRIYDIYPFLVLQSSYFNSTLNMTLTAPKSVRLPLEKCSLRINKYVKYKKLLEDEVVDRNGYCLPPEIDVNITSPIGYPTNQFLSIVFQRCENITQIGKTNCYPPDVIEEKLKDVFVGIFLIDNYFDHNNLYSPAQPYIKFRSIHAGVSPYIFRELFIDMKNVDYYTDVNYLISNQQKVEYNIVDKIQERTTTSKQNMFPGSFATISIAFGNIRQIYERKYYKLQNMLADLGGLVNALITITFNFNLYFSKKSFFNKIIDFNSNSLYIYIYIKLLTSQIP